MAPKRLVILCEGHGDEQAAPVLVNKLLAQLDPARQFIFCDTNPFRNCGLTNLVGKGSVQSWVNKVKAAAKRGNVGAMLLLLDGDYDGMPFNTPEGKRYFCAKEFATMLAWHAKSAGAGRHFSLAVVFVRQEFESWLIAGCPEFQNHAPGKAEDIEARSGAKEWITKHGRPLYKPPIHQAELTRQMDLASPLLNEMRSYKRFQNAMRQLVHAVRDLRAVCTPESL